MSNTQFVLSYEILLLLRWLTDHNKDTLRKLIGNAIKSGLTEELKLLERSNDLGDMEEIQHSITDFLSLLETLLVSVMRDHVKEKARQQKLLPAVDHIDTTICDSSTVQHSLEKATSTLESNPEANAKELLYKEILKRWHPADKNVKH